MKQEKNDNVTNYSGKARKCTLRFAFRASLPVMAGYIVIGMGFGVLVYEAGLAWYWALFMSVAIYAGSMQYVTIDLITGGASLITSALMAFFVNARHMFYGLTMLEKYKDTGMKKPYLIYALTDETFSLVCSPELPAGVDPRGYYFDISLLNQCYWVAGSVIGAILGNFLPFDTTGVDFAMTALFTIIFVEQWEKAGTHVPAITGVASSLVCLVIFGPSNFLLPSMIAMIAILLVYGKVRKGGSLI